MDTLKSQSNGTDRPGTPWGQHYNDVAMQGYEKNISPAYQTALRNTKQNLTARGMGSSGMSAFADMDIRQKEAQDKSGFQQKLGMRRADLGEQNRQRLEQRSWQVQDRDIRYERYQEQLKEQRRQQQEDQKMQMFGQIAGGITGGFGSILGNWMGTPGAEEAPIADQGGGYVQAFDYKPQLATPQYSGYSVNGQSGYSAPRLSGYGDMSAQSSALDNLWGYE